MAARVSSSAAAAASSGTSKPRTAAECLAKFLSLPLEREAGGKGGNAGAAGASEWVRRLAAGVDGQGAWLLCCLLVGWVWYSVVWMV